MAFIRVLIAGAVLAMSEERLTQRQAGAINFCTALTPPMECCASVVNCTVPPPPSATSCCPTAGNYLTPTLACCPDISECCESENSEGRAIWVCCHATDEFCELQSNLQGLCKPLNVATNAPTPAASTSAPTTTPLPVRPTLSPPTDRPTPAPTSADTSAPTSAPVEICSNGALPLKSSAGAVVTCSCFSGCPNNTRCEKDTSGSSRCCSFRAADPCAAHPTCAHCLADTACQYQGASGCVSKGAAAPDACFATCPGSSGSGTGIDGGVPGTCYRRCGQIGAARTEPGWKSMLNTEALNRALESGGGIAQELLTQGKEFAASTKQFVFGVVGGMYQPVGMYQPQVGMYQPQLGFGFGQPQFGFAGQFYISPPPPPPPPVFYPPALPPPRGYVDPCSCDSQALDIGDACANYQAYCSV